MYDETNVEIDTLGLLLYCWIRDVSIERFLYNSSIQMYCIYCIHVEKNLSRRHQQ
jgi:hypothetical protein